MKSELTDGRSAKQEYWQDHIRAWEKGGLTQAAYCQAHSLALQTFGYWRRKCKQKVGATRPKFFPLAVLPLPISATSSASGKIRLTLQERRFLIEVDDDFSSSTLQRLIATLEQL